MNAITAVVAIFALALGAGAHAQNYPHKPVRVVVPFPPGGGADIAGRLVMQRVAERSGWSFVIDNRAGAGGTIGTDIVAKAPADGYTLLAASSSHTIAPSLYKKLPYDPVRGFAPITMSVSGPGLLVVHPSIAAKSARDLIALAKSKPGQLNYASAGNGTPPHLAAELFKSMAGIDIVHVPYIGGPPAFTALIAGQVSLSFPTIPGVLPHVQSGRLRALGVTTKQRSGILPELSTIAESGLPGYDASSWFGVLAPAGTPAGIVLKLQQQIAEVLKLPDIRERLLAQGLDPVGNSPAGFAAIIASEIVKWQKVVAASGISIE